MADQINVTITLANVLPLIGVLVLTAITSACLGLLVGTIVKPRQIAAMFPGFFNACCVYGSHFLFLDKFKQCAGFPMVDTD